MTTSHVTPRLLLGLAVIGLGVLFTLDNLGMVDLSAVLTFWPVVLIVIGFVQLSSGQWLGALGWFLVGTLLLLNSLEVIEIDVFDLWPILLVLIGINIVRKSFGYGRRRRANESQVNSFSLMSGQSRKINSPDFTAGDFTAIMGGSEIDLRDADIGNGERVIDVFALWGGIEIRVPEEWTVIPKVGTFMGGFEDKTARAKANPEKRLIIRGLALMGGVEVRN